MTDLNGVSRGLNNPKRVIGVEMLVKVAVMSAITFVAAFALHIPYINGNVLHMGDGMVFIGAIVLGPVWGAVSAAIGMSAFDIISNYPLWAPFTFIIKAGMALIVGYAALGLRGEDVRRMDWIKAAIGMVVAAIFMCGGYYIAEGIIYGNWQSPILSLPGNIAQSGLGVIVGLVITGALWKTPFKKEFVK